MELQQLKLMLPDIFTNMEELYGGLRSHLDLPWYYPISIDSFEREVEKRHNKCVQLVFSASDFDKVETRRRHGRLIDNRTTLFFPEQVKKLKLPSKLGTHLWKTYSKNFKPDRDYMAKLENTLLKMLPKIVKCKEYIDAFTLNDGLVDFNWLTTRGRLATIKAMDSFLKDQPNLTHVILENAFLLPLDGLKLLFIIGYNCGETIEYLDMVNFFKNGFHPIQWKERSLEDPFVVNTEQANVSSKQDRQTFRNKYIEPRNDKKIPTNQLSTMYKLCLNSFVELTYLCIPYSYLSEGQGRTLCQIGSIINGKLEDLCLLCGPNDLPKNTNQVISSAAWEHSLSLCPYLRVHIIMSVVPFYDDIKTVIDSIMPLESFHLEVGLTVYPDNTSGDWLFGSTIKMLITYFQRTLRKISLHLCHSKEKLDVSICRCLLHLFYLEEFEYRGPFDKLDTLNALCEFVVTNSFIRLKSLVINVVVDVCNEEQYEEAIRKLYEKFKGQFIACDKHFALQTCLI